MPLYEYKCKRCGQRFEKLVRWNADPKAIICPACATPEPERQISLPATTAHRAACGTTAGG